MSGNNDDLGGNSSHSVVDDEILSAAADDTIDVEDANVQSNSVMNSSSITASDVEVDIQTFERVGGGKVKKHFNLLVKWIFDNCSTTKESATTTENSGVNPHRLNRRPFEGVRHRLQTCMSYFIQILVFLSARHKTRPFDTYMSVVKLTPVLMKIAKAVKAYQQIMIISKQDVDKKVLSLPELEDVTNAIVEAFLEFDDVLIQELHWTPLNSLIKTIHLQLQNNDKQLDLNELSDLFQQYMMQKEFLGIQTRFNKVDWKLKDIRSKLYNVEKTQTEMKAAIVEQANQIKIGKEEIISRMDTNFEDTNCLIEESCEKVLTALNELKNPVNVESKEEEKLKATPLACKADVDNDWLPQVDLEPDRAPNQSRQRNAMREEEEEEEKEENDNDCDDNTDNSILCMSSYIRRCFKEKQWLPLLVYIHANTDLQRDVVSSLASSVLSTDRQNFENHTAKCTLDIPHGSEIIVVPTISCSSPDFNVADVQVYPQQHSLLWNGDVAGEQFFLYFNEKVSSFKEIEVTVNYFYEGIAIGKAFQLMKSESRIANDDDEDGQELLSSKIDDCYIQSYSNIVMVFHGKDDKYQKEYESYHDQSKAGMNVKCIQLSKFEEHLKSIQYSRDSQSPFIQFFVTNNLLEDCNSLKTAFDYMKAHGEKGRWAFCCCKGIRPTIPDQLKSMIQQLTFFHFKIEKTNGIAELLQIQKNTLKAVVNLQFAEYPIYSFVSNDRYPDDDPSEEGSTTTCCGTLSSFWDQLYDNPLCNWVRSIFEKTVYVSFMCEDSLCKCSSNHLVHKPFEMHVASDFLVKAAPYLKAMSMALKAAKCASAVAGLPIPFDIPSLPNVFDGEKLISLSDAMVGYADFILLEDKFEKGAESVEEREKLSKATQELKDIDALLAEKRTQDGLQEWRRLIEKHVGVNWVAETKLKRVVVVGNGNVKWVCHSCYEKRWKDIDDLDHTVIYDNQQTPSKVLVETKNVDLSLLDFFYALQPSFHLDAYDVAAMFQREGIKTKQHLQYVDFVLKVENDFNEVRSLLASRLSELTLREINIIVDQIMSFRMELNDSRYVSRLQDGFSNFVNFSGGDIYGSLCLKTGKDESKSFQKFIKAQDPNHKYSFTQELGALFAKMEFLVALENATR